jgi:hypothetical protein
MNCTLNLLPKAASQTPRDRPLCVDERGILKSDIFFRENCAKLGRNIRRRTVTLSKSSDSNAALDSPSVRYYANYYPGHGPVSRACGRSAQPERSGRSSSAASRSSKSLILRATTATNQKVGVRISGALLYAGRTISAVYKLQVLICSCYVSDIAPSERDGVCRDLLRFCYRVEPEVSPGLAPAARFERRT